MNNRGQVVGEYLDGEGAFHGYVWEKGRFKTIEGSEEPAAPPRTSTTGVRSSACTGRVEPTSSGVSSSAGASTGPSTPQEAGTTSRSG